jgi:hypothetical protein
MDIIIKLNVMYDYPVDAVLPFVLSFDKASWENCLSCYSYEMFMCRQKKQIFFLLRNCADSKSIEGVFNNLPLIREGFFEINIYEGIGIENLDSFFNPYL